jgi:hypothetical protein
MLEQRLSQLAIEERKGVPISVNVAVRHVKAAFGGTNRQECHVISMHNCRPP